MAENAEVNVQGAEVGEPATVATGSGLSDEELLARVGADESKEEAKANPDEEFYTKLRGFDPSKLPDDIRQKFELPFLQQYTRKTTEDSQRQQKLFEGVITKLNSQGIQPTQDQRSELLERIRSGDFEAVSQLIEHDVNQRVAPVAQQVAFRDAIEKATVLHPYVQQKQQEVANVLSQNPQLAQMAMANNYAFAPQVLAGIALQIENQELKARAESAKVDEVAIARRAIEAYKKQVRGIPAITSKAGTTVSGKTGGQGTQSFKEAAAAAFREMGIDPGPYFQG